MAEPYVTQWSMAAETKEWVGPITVTVNGIPTIDYQVTVTAGSNRPTTWVSPTLLGAGRGLMVGESTPWPLRVGATYTLWVKYNGAPETPVERVGIIKVT